MDDLGAKLEEERQWAVRILRTMADKLESLSLDDVTEPLTLVMGAGREARRVAAEALEAVRGASAFAVG